MKKLIILRGNSGSGKTTVARELQRKIGRNTLLISQDMVRREMLLVKDGPENPAIPLLIGLLEYGWECVPVTILEGIFHAEWYAPLFERAATLYRENILAYYYDIPFEETLRRHQTRANRDAFGEKEMRDWWLEKDLIGSIPETILTKEMGIEQVVDMIYRAAMV